MRTFTVHRSEDVSGISGTGLVAVGAVFPSGRCVVEWTGRMPSLEISTTIADWLSIHGHGGKTLIVYDNELVVGN